MAERPEFPNPRGKPMDSGAFTTRFMLAALFALMSASLVQLPITAKTRFALAKNDDRPLYNVGDVVRLRCDGGDEVKFGSIYSSEHGVWAIYDPTEPTPKAARMIRSGTRLEVLATSRHQTFTALSHTPFINLEILKVGPVTGARWYGYVDSILVDPDSGPNPKDTSYICE